MFILFRFGDRTVWILGCCERDTPHKLIFSQRQGDTYRTVPYLPPIGVSPGAILFALFKKVYSSV